jgi:hypothetical protein
MGSSKERGAPAKRPAASSKSQELSARGSIQKVRGGWLALIYNIIVCA